MMLLRAALLLLVLVSSAFAQRTWDTDILAETFGFNEETKRSVELGALMQGCPRRDCIPSIDQPKYVSAESAKHVDDSESVIAININGDARAYPTRILDHHEIVNDTIGGEPIAVTWCPLCGSAVGVRRELGGEVTELGVSGVLYNSDLVFYDRKTETLWDQIEAKGIVGPLTGETLEFVPVTMTKWGRWRTAHPDTKVLAEDTGFDFDYSKDRYAEYRESTRLFMPVSNTDDRVHPKTVVYGFNLDDGPIAFAASLFNGASGYQHEDMTVTRLKDGSIQLHREGDAQAYTPIRLFWFAWYTFHPETAFVN
jgi:hypothetical protein